MTTFTTVCDFLFRKRVERRNIVSTLGVESDLHGNQQIIWEAGGAAYQLNTSMIPKIVSNIQWVVYNRSHMRQAVRVVDRVSTLRVFLCIHRHNRVASFELHIKHAVQGLNRHRSEKQRYLSSFFGVHLGSNQLNVREECCPHHIVKD